MLFSKTIVLAIMGALPCGGTHPGGRRNLGTSREPLKLKGVRGLAEDVVASRFVDSDAEDYESSKSMKTGMSGDRNEGEYYVDPKGTSRIINMLAEKVRVHVLGTKQFYAGVGIFDVSLTAPVIYDSDDLLQEYFLDPSARSSLKDLSVSTLSIGGMPFDQAVTAVLKGNRRLDGVAVDEEILTEAFEEKSLHVSLLEKSLEEKEARISVLEDQVIQMELKLKELTELVLSK